MTVFYKLIMIYLVNLKLAVEPKVIRKVFAEVT